jgi:hypothetical protein
MKGRPEGCPDKDNQNRNRESQRTAKNIGGLSSENVKSILHTTEKAALLALLRPRIVIGLSDSNVSIVFPKADARMNSARLVARR